MVRMRAIEMTEKEEWGSAVVERSDQARVQVAGCCFAAVGCWLLVVAAFAWKFDGFAWIANLMRTQELRLRLRLDFEIGVLWLGLSEKSTLSETVRVTDRQLGSQKKSELTPPAFLG